MYEEDWVVISRRAVRYRHPEEGLVEAALAPHIFTLRLPRLSESSRSALPS